MRLFIIFTCISLCFTGCQARQPFCYDFEIDDTLDTLQWKCKTFYSLSDQHVTSGRKSLKVELYPSPYPGVTLTNFNPDWSGYDTLKFEVYNQEKILLNMGIRIDDTENPPHNNRYNRSLILKPGENYVSIPLNSLFTSETNRKLDISKVHELYLFLSSPKEKRTIFLDNVRLE